MPTLLRKIEKKNKIDYDKYYLVFSIYFKNNF